VPQRLLKQFSYWHDATNSLRLWKYEKGLEPFGKASPKSAATRERHFADPNNVALEIEVETTLAREIEEPVNSFLSQFCDPNFGLNEDQRRKMTRYVTMLFSRSAARREGSEHTQEIMVRALESFLQNESQLLTVSAHWFFLNKQTVMFPISAVKEAARNLMRDTRTSDALQRNFVAQVRNAMRQFDEKLFRGNWELIVTTEENPFILADSPVATWVRDHHGDIDHGSGFERPDVEVVLPLAPVTCLHIAPDVPRSRPMVRPTVQEVNVAQATFACKACYANLRSGEIDELVQNTPRKKFGQDFFTLGHRDYDSLFYEFLMQQSGR
jgi:Protein of unknown function (DUF4238)